MMNRGLIVVALLFVVGSSLLGQRKYLVTPTQEVIPMDSRNNRNEISSQLNQYRSQVSTACGSTVTLGFPASTFTPNLIFQSYHRDVIGQWYVVPADGMIDTIIFRTGSSVGPFGDLSNMDSTLYLAVYSSRISESAGPGVQPGPYHPPCETWGYWINTNDNDQGITPFREYATDTTWQATNLIFGDTVQSFPPIDSLLWGGAYGAVNHVQPNADMKIDLNAVAPLNVHKGDVIFITLRIPSAYHLPYDVAVDIEGSTINPPYPSRAWKFFEHDSGIANCSGRDPSVIRRGWAALGSPDGDSTVKGVYNIWYVMTPTSNLPPVIANVNPVHTTISTGPQSVSATIYDCDPENQSLAGVESAVIKYHMDNYSVWSTTPMSGSLDQFTGALPGIPSFHSMTYKIVATDSTGASDSSATFTYRVVDLNSTGWYRCDTTGTPTPANIASLGTAIDTSAWFVPPRAYLGGKTPHRGDDGTAGPFAISGGFPYYGDTMYYAWVGVNGAIALSKTATDTIDVNANGSFSDQFDIPYPQRHSRQDTVNENNMPKAFIAPYWADWVVVRDSPRYVIGRIRYYDDSAKFVAEWDSVLWASSGVGGQPEIDVFRVVLDKINNCVEFQYDEIGYADPDSVSLVGMQSDSNYHPTYPGGFPPYNFFNKHGYPTQTRLHNGLHIQYLPVIACVAASDGWNMISDPGCCDQDNVPFLFPNARSRAFAYINGSYSPQDSIECDRGFWIKFAGAQTICFTGKCCPCKDFLVTTGFNLIGSLCSPVATSAIVADAGTGITLGSTYFTYSGSYSIASMIYPGVGYWVRAFGPGYIHICINGTAKIANPANELAGMAKVAVAGNTGPAQDLFVGTGSFDPDKYLMPPPVPQGGLDARFASGRMVETYPEVLDPTKTYAYPIVINTASYPVTISWNNAESDPRHLLTLMTEDGKRLAEMRGSGQVTLGDARISRVKVIVSEGAGLPKEYALAQNYPNPFNPTTTIEYQLPAGSRVHITVYNLLGQVVATLADGVQQAGYRSVTWDAVNFSSGVYFYRLDATSTSGHSKTFTQERKMVVMK